MSDHSITSFQQRLIKSKWEPSVENLISRIDYNLEWWSRYQDYMEHIQEFFQIIAFISVFFNYKIITGASIALSGALSRAITNSNKKQSELKSERKSIYHEIGVDKYLPHPTSDVKNEV